MFWFILLVVIATVLCIVFFRKPKTNEIVVRIETASSPSSGPTTADNGLDEEKDNWERFNYYGAKTLPGKGRYRISYEDQRGLRTEREIQVKRVYENGGEYALDAHCFLRNAHRSFVNEQIRRAINVDTGEIVENLARHAMAQYNDSDENRVVTEDEPFGVGAAEAVDLNQQADRIALI